MQAPLHLGYKAVEYIRHQRQYPWIGVLHARPYISRLIWGMGFAKETWGMQREGGTIPLGIDTQLAIWMIKRKDIVDNAKYTLGDISEF